MYTGPNIITDGLVFYLDVANQKSLDTRNLLYNTDTLTGWGKAPFAANITVSPNAAIAVDGKPTASKIKFNESAAVRCSFRNAILSLNDTNTFSVYVKSVSGSSTITLDIGDQGNKSFTVNDTEWTRCYTTHTRTSQYGSTTYFVDISATAGTEVYVCNAQLNFGELIDYVAVGDTSMPFKNLIKPSENTVLTNGPIFYSENNGSISFDGVNDSVTLDTALSLEESWTLNYWQTLNINENDYSIPTLFWSNTEVPGSAGSFSMLIRIFSGLSYVLIDSDDSMYVGGQFGGYDNIVRDTLVKINEDGSPNTQFNSGRSIVNGGVVSVNKLHKLSNGKLFSVGTNWGPTGVTILDPELGTPLPDQLSIAPTGSIAASFIIDENSDSMWVLDSWSSLYQNQNITGKIFKIKLSDFSIDTGFDSSTGFKSTVGKTTVSSTEGVTGGIVLQDGNLICFGTFMEYKGVPASRLVKINSTTAAIDTSFAYGTGFNSTVYDAVQLNNGTIVVSGQFTSYNGTPVNRIVSLNNDGSINSNFSIGAGFNERVYSVIYDSVNDKIFCLGTFTNYKGVTANRIVKLNSDGSIDSSFNYGTGFSATTNHAALDSQGRLVVLTAAESTYQGLQIPRRICRINADGSLDTSFNSGGFNIDRFRHDFLPKLVDNSTPFFTGPFGINANREIVNQPNGAMTFNGTKLYTLAFNHTTNQISTYINGELKRTLSLTARLPLRCKTFGGYSKFYNVSVYDRALTASEVLQNYNAISSRLRD